MNKRIKVIAGAAVVGLVAAGGAFAYWTFGGAGTGSAQTAANPASAIVVSQTAVTNLAPGMSVPLAGQLTNPNVTDVKVGTLTAAISVPAGVALGDFSLTGNPLIIDKVVKTGAPVDWSGMTLVYANSDLNQDNARNVPVTLTYTLSPFVEPPVMPALETRTRTSPGSATVVVYIHHSGSYVIQPGDRLVLVSTTGGVARSAVLATADSSGNIYYTGPTTVGNSPTDVVTSEVYAVGASLIPGTSQVPNPGQHWVGIGF